VLPLVAGLVASATGKMPHRRVGGGRPSDRAHDDTSCLRAGPSMSANAVTGVPVRYTRVVRVFMETGFPAAPFSHQWRDFGSGMSRPTARSPSTSMTEAIALAGMLSGAAVAILVPFISARLEGNRMEQQGRDARLEELRVILDGAVQRLYDAWTVLYEVEQGSGTYASQTGMVRVPSCQPPRPAHEADRFDRPGRARNTGAHTAGRSNQRTPRRGAHAGHEVRVRLSKVPRRRTPRPSAAPQLPRRSHSPMPPSPSSMRSERSSA
jgi:hypothetical protein